MRVALRKKRRLLETIDPPNDSKTFPSVVKPLRWTVEATVTCWTCVLRASLNDGTKVITVMTCAMRSDLVDALSRLLDSIP